MRRFRSSPWASRLNPRLLAALLLTSGLACSGNAPSSNAPTTGQAAPEPSEPPIVSESQLPPAPTTLATSDPSAGDASSPRPRPIDAVEPITLATPPFQRSAPHPLTLVASTAPQLRQLKATRNQITDDQQWFTQNALKSNRLPASGFGNSAADLPRGLPREFGQLVLADVFVHDDHRILSFGQNFAGGFVLALQKPDGDTMQVYDLSNYRRAPRTFPGDERFVDQLVRWAQLKDGILFVATAHRTYAKSSFQKNAFITALDQQTGELRWQSDPLVANSLTFLIRDSYIISGYGFTAEPDHLFLIDRSNGQTVRRVPVASGPNWILEKDGQLFVRTYDMNYVFSL